MNKLKYVVIKCKCNNCNIERSYERNLSKEEVKTLIESPEVLKELVIDDYIHTCPNTDEEGYYDVYEIKGPLDRN